jgi:hypothetical protein
MNGIKLLDHEETITDSAALAIMWLFEDEESYLLIDLWPPTFGSFWLYAYPMLKSLPMAVNLTPGMGVGGRITRLDGNSVVPLEVAPRELVEQVPTINRKVQEYLLSILNDRPILVPYTNGQKYGKYIRYCYAGFSQSDPLAVFPRQSGFVGAAAVAETFNSPFLNAHADLVKTTLAFTHALKKANLVQNEREQPPRGAHDAPGVSESTSGREWEGRGLVERGGGGGGGRGRGGW